VSPLLRSGAGAGADPGGRVVVLGSGHNALVGACYLARAGLDVEVVEQDTVLGGAVSTVERFPGYLMDRGSSAHIMIRWTGIVEDLELERFGLRYVDCDPWGFHPVPGAPGGGITFAVDLDRTCASIEAVCGVHDADAYRGFVADWGDRNERVFEAFGAPPTGASLGRALWGTGKGTGLSGLELARQFLMPGDALLDSLFDSEHLKTALSWLGAQSGPPISEVATADLVGWNALLHRRPPGRAVGGSGALTSALRARLEADGGRVRLGDAATGIETSGSGVRAVRTASGDRLPADAVLAGCHVLTTYELLGDAIPAAEQERVRRTVRVGNGLGMVVRLGTTGLPHYPDAPDDVSAGLALATPSRTALRRAYGDFLAGEAPREPAALGMAFSYLDPSIAPAGRHNVTIWGQWHPYELASGEHWDTIREREGEKLVTALDRVAPGFAGSVERMYVQTPLDLERELGLRRGNVMHVEMGLDEMFAWRPLPELAGYRGPVDGLYLCGASTHPGGGVFGASGRSAARVLLKDREPALWRRALGRLPRPGAANSRGGVGAATDR
jgi:phytoene dehydrogenase-like protein